MTELDDLRARLDALEKDKADQARRLAEWFARPIEERVELLAAGMAGTSPDGIQYIVDYSLPADTPAYSRISADSVQAALNTRSPTHSYTDVHVGQGQGWDVYTPITVLGENNGWQGIGSCLTLTPESRAGLWEVRTHAYLEVAGGTASAMACFLTTWPTWAGAPVADQRNPTIGRLTAPPGQRIVASKLAIAHFANVPGSPLWLRAAANIDAAVAGGYAKVGLVRISALFTPNAASIGSPGYVLPPAAAAASLDEEGA